MLNQLKNEKRSLHLQQNKNSKKPEKKKKIEKTREKAIKGLIDFNKFIKDDSVERGQRNHLILERIISNKKSSTVTEDEDEKKKVRNLYKALTNDSKSAFDATNKITKTLVKKQETHYIKKTLFL